MDAKKSTHDVWQRVRNAATASLHGQRRTPQSPQANSTILTFFAFLPTHSEHSSGYGGAAAAATSDQLQVTQHIDGDK